MGERVLTKAQHHALLVILEEGPAAASARTELAPVRGLPPTIAGRVATTLSELGMIVQLSEHQGRPVYGLTDAGEVVARRAAATRRPTP